MLGEDGGGAVMDNIGIQKRKVRKIVIEEDRCGDWRIRLYFDKGRCKVYGETYDHHRNAVLAASGIPLEHPWVPPIQKGE